VNSRLANKVLNAHLHALDKLDLDSAGVRGEMGHMVVELRAMDVLVWHAISQATVHHEEFKRSKVAGYENSNPGRVHARHFGMAAKEVDVFVLASA
jgi:protein-tyrosine-phosphatase